MCTRAPRQVCQTQIFLGFYPKESHPADLGWAQNWRFNKQPKMILLTSLHAAKATEQRTRRGRSHFSPLALHQLAKVLWTFLDVQSPVLSQCGQWQNIRIAGWNRKAWLQSHTPAGCTAISEGKARKTAFSAGAPSGSQRRLHQQLLTRKRPSLV